MSIEWIFERAHPMGGAAGQAFNNPLQGTMPPEALLAREAIQNSCDAAQPRDAKVHVVFRHVKLYGVDKAIFIDSIGLLQHFGPRKELLGLFSSNCLAESDSPDIPLGLLYIEDYRTHGLYGDPHSSDSHFHRLLLSLGDDAKSHESGSTGGSYGFGKSVYSANSRIHTIMAYSLFNHGDNGSSTCARVMGCAFFDKHKLDGQEYTGRAWSGTDTDADSGIVYPFEDHEARELASQLGFKTRSEGERGTSILILDCSISMENLRRYIEDCWWPRLCEDWLDVDLYEGDRRLPPPRPRGREELRPFIECFDLATKRSEPTGPHQRTSSFNRFNNKELGSYGYQTVDPDLANKECMQDYLNHVALIRVPRMVVAFENLGRTSPPSVGTFVAHQEIDTYLRLSESASHDKWDPTSARLGHLGEDARTFVKAVIDRLKQSFRKFQNESSPPQPPGERRLRLFERDLGALFRLITDKGLPPRGEVDPIVIHFQKQPRAIAEDGRLITSAAFNISLRDDAYVEKATVILSARVAVLEDDNAAEGDAWPIRLDWLDTGETFAVDKEAKVPLEISKGDKQRFSIQSEPYDPSWSTRVVISVTRNEEV